MLFFIFGFFFVLTVNNDRRKREGRVRIECRWQSNQITDDKRWAIVNKRPSILSNKQKINMSNIPPFSVAATRLRMHASECFVSRISCYVSIHVLLAFYNFLSELLNFPHWKRSYHIYNGRFPCAFISMFYAWIPDWHAIEKNANYTDTENRNWFREYTKHFVTFFCINCVYWQPRT